MLKIEKEDIVRALYYPQLLKQGLALEGSYTYDPKNPYILNEMKEKTRAISVQSWFHLSKTRKKKHIVFGYSFRTNDDGTKTFTIKRRQVKTTRTR